MNIVDLYKEHINPTPTGVEIHELFHRFKIQSLDVLNPLDDEYNKELIRSSQVRRNLCIEWVLKNSKL